MGIGNVDKKVNNMKRKAIKLSQLENNFYEDDTVGKSKKIFPFQSTCEVEIERAISFKN